MFKLLKWGLGITAVGFVVPYLVFGNGATSYIGAALGEARNSVKESIPIGFEIKRSDRLIRKIEPQIRECLKDVAVGEVEMDSLKASITKLREKEKDYLVRLTHRKSMLEDGQAVYCVAGLELKRGRLERDLERIFEQFKNTQGLLRSKESLLVSQQKALYAAKRKLETVLEERARLQEMLKSLKTQKRQLDTLAAQSRRFDLDDSSLVQAAKSLSEVKKRLDVAQKMLEADFLEFESLPEAETIDQPAPPGRDIVNEVNDYLNKGRPQQIQTGNEPEILPLTW